MIVGELINTSRKAIRPLVADYDENAILEIVNAQVESGADYIDLNCGTFLKDEADRLTWLVKLVTTNTNKPICLDSPDPKALEAALPFVSGQAIINSISGEKERFANLLPLALEYKTKIIALCMNDDEMPIDAEGRYAIGSNLIDRLAAAGMQLSDIYLDPLVQPAFSAPQGGNVIFETIKRLKAAYPGINCICGLSNISFGLPNRKLINRYFLAQTMAAGMDSYILDPIDKQLMGCYLASKVLVGQDKFCVNYLKAHRKGLFE